MRSVHDPLAVDKLLHGTAAGIDAATQLAQGDSFGQRQRVGCCAGQALQTRAQPTVGSAADA